MSRPPLDLRSDTVTRPTLDMRAAMARAEVGDDVYREDPTTRALEEKVAELVGKEAALFVPTGTMGNQIALLVHTQRGAEVIVGEGAHVANFESGAAAAWSGVQFAVAGRGGVFTAADVRAQVRPAGEMFPQTALVSVENTHNRSGGRVFPLDDVLAIAHEARRHHLALHLDGSRLWNAAVASGMSEASLSAPFDTVNVCFSKGLGAPAGSALAGSKALVERARRFRKMLGGGMRQTGVLAAAALYALEHHRRRLIEDHDAARRIAVALAGCPGVIVNPRDVETNIVVVTLSTPSAAEVVRSARDLGVLCQAISPDAIRLVTHLDFPLDAAENAAAILARAVSLNAT
ncbi:MAG: aminotransferase class I/II-fold pyridoxal phosphate-dependent enzyme [Myxococcota bacterium]|nr:aminotransferase class I/II-fold pyridoxal phosphate-dependent enzyme [Myxococcota bacterium]